MAKTVLHVVPHDQGWAVKREGNDRVNSLHGTQKEAIESAREAAEEKDDIVIHRPDGTIRERVTYSGTSGNGNNTAETTETRDRATVEPRDVASVGTRVRWSAVFAGVVVGFAVYLTLSVLALAVGVSTVDHMNGRSFAITAAVVSAVILLAAMFLGGFVVSRSTVGEQPGEGVTYGVLVWGTMLMFLIVGGVGLGVGTLAGLRQATPEAVASGDSEAMKRDLGWSDQQVQAYNAYVQKGREIAHQSDPRALAWWTFATVLVSLLAAMGGGYLGARPELGWRRATPTQTVAVVAPRPA